MALDGIEDAVRSALGRSPNARQPAKAHVVRYADDFIVTGATRELLEHRVKPAIDEFLAVRGLQLAPEKTLITHISRRFDFLGQNVRKYGDKLLIKPARKSVASLLSKVREMLGKNKAATQSQVIMLLAPDPSGLGGVPPAYRGCGDLLTDRSSRVDQVVGMGQTPPPAQAHALDQGAVLRAPWSARLGLRMHRSAAGVGLQADAVPAGWAAHQTPHEGSQRCQPVRPGMDRVLPASCKCSLTPM